jgi:hypothetical protein
MTPKPASAAHAGLPNIFQRKAQDGFGHHFSIALMFASTRHAGWFQNVLRQ